MIDVIYNYRQSDIHSLSPLTSLTSTAYRLKIR